MHHPYEEALIREMIRPANILLVEDDMSYAEMMLKVMREFHCIPTHAPDGAKALATLKMNTNWNLVMLDLVLPIVSGMDVLKYIFTSGSDIPLVVVSGHITEEVITEINSFGIVPFACKGANSIENMRRLLRSLGIRPLPSTLPKFPV